MKFKKIDITNHSLPLGRSLIESLALKGLHCGSGANLKPSCLNSDSMQFIDERGFATKPGALCLVDDSFFYLQHDATKSFPIENGVFQWIYSEHFIEHIPQTLALAWFKDMRRLLHTDGLIRVSTPDLEKYVRGYLDPEEVFFKEHVKRLANMGVTNVPTRRAWLVNQIFRNWGHQHIYDFDEIKFVASLAGFPVEKAQKCEFRTGIYPELADLDREVRSDESLYVELPLK